MFIWEETSKILQVKTYFMHSEVKGLILQKQYISRLSMGLSRPDQLCDFLHFSQKTICLRL